MRVHAVLVFSHNKRFLKSTGLCLIWSKNDASLFQTFFSFRFVSDESLYNGQRFPTTLSFGQAGFVNTAKAITQLLEKFSWRTISLLCDDLSQMPGSNVFFRQLCFRLIKHFGENKSKYVLHVERYDSGEAHDSDKIYMNTLLLAGSHSRGKLQS
jgi:hypothetical protein